jgi:hypothetical protein
MQSVSEDGRQRDRATFGQTLNSLSLSLFPNSFNHSYLIRRHSLTFAPQHPTRRERRREKVVSNRPDVGRCWSMTVGCRPGQVAVGEIGFFVCSMFVMMMDQNWRKSRLAGLTRTVTADLKRSLPTPLPPLITINIISSYPSTHNDRTKEHCCNKINFGFNVQLKPQFHFRSFDTVQVDATKKDGGSNRCFETLHIDSFIFTVTFSRLFRNKKKRKNFNDRKCNSAFPLFCVNQ